MTFELNHQAIAELPAAFAFAVIVAVTILVLFELLARYGEGWLERWARWRGDS